MLRVLLSTAALTVAATAAAQDGPIERWPAQLMLELRSDWSYNCHTGLADTGYTPPFGGWTNWTDGLITSEWNGAPWSCLQARVYSDSPQTAIRVQFSSSWTSACSTGHDESGFSGRDGRFGRFSRGVVTSEWDGAPWSCLQARVATSPDVSCKIRLYSEWSSSCQTSVVGTGPVRFDENGASAWTAPLITSEWNGGPWSCLRAQLLCAAN